MNSESAPAPGIRPEHQLILWCARTRLDAEKAERVRAVFREEIDLAYVAATAIWHAVEPLLYWQLKAVRPECVPANWMELLRISFVNNAWRSLWLSAELCGILDTLEANEILAVPYKGPALGVLAYGNVALRDFVDLDFLLRPQDIPKASRLLVGQGYRAEFELPSAAGNSSQRVPGQYLFTREGRRIIVELHTPLTLRYYPVRLDLERMSQRLEYIQLGGREIPTFSPEDSLILISVHSSKHFWDRLKWVCDVAELVQVPGGINWESAQEEGRRLGCERMLLLGLCLAHDLLDAPLPEELVRCIGTNRIVQALARQVGKRLFEQDRAARGVVQRFLFRSRMRGNLREGTQYCLRLATKPTEEDWSRFRLPTPLAPLYSVARLLRLVRTHGVGLVRRPAPDLARFVPTPPEIVDRMLALAEVRPGDVLYDVGCGDGRIVVTAAKRFGVRGVGVDIDLRRIAEARANARREGVQHLVRFLQQDLRAVNVSEATVVTLYLGMPANILLRQKLVDQLRAGTRIVSADFDMGEWLPEKTEDVETQRGTRKTLYLWRIEGRRPAGAPEEDFASRAAGPDAEVPSDRAGPSVVQQR